GWASPRFAFTGGFCMATPRLHPIIAETANVRASCEKAGISRKGAYKARGKNEKFANDWDDAIKDAVDKLELAAVARREWIGKAPILRQSDHPARSMARFVASSSNFTMTGVSFAAIT